MKTKRVFLIALLGSILFVLNDPTFATAQEKKPKSYSSIYVLKKEFEKAGGQCWEWSKNDQLFAWVTGDCDKNTVLIFYPKKTNTLADALQMAKTYRSIKVKVNLLVGPNWIINSDQVNIVRKKLGGTLITR